MKKFVRSLFGLSNEGRKVVGTNINFDLKDVALIKSSNSRLNSLQVLISRYKNTLHEPKIKLAYEKTKSIHHYLVNKNRIQELELFHIQNTDHFINTFNVIMDAFQMPKENADPPPRPEIIDIVNKKRVSRSAANIRNETQKKPFDSSYATQTEEATNDVPTLKIPDISLNTYSKIIYPYKDVHNVMIDREIGFFSPKEDKESFLDEVSRRLKLPKEDIAYVGNAMVNNPDQNSKFKQLEYIPIIHWQGYMYALHLKDFRLFPVTMQRKNR